MDAVPMISKRITLTQWPVYYSPEAYHDAINDLCLRLQSISGLKAIYQIGGISDYGISDIDLLIVFESTINFQEDPLNLHGIKANRYLFTHRLFGTTENRLESLENFTLFGNYSHLYGNQYKFAISISGEDKKIIEKQIALEYMLKAFISLHISLTYGQVKVRNLLLHVKALRLDLELLGIKGGLFHELVHELTGLRKNWFLQTPQQSQFTLKVIRFYEQFKTVMEKLFQEHPFYILAGNPVRIARHIEIIPRPAFRPPRTSVSPLLKLLIPENRKEKILNRIMLFRFELPVNLRPAPEIIQQRHHYIREGIEFNRANLPWFLCTAYGMDIFSH
jgi:hypothetical protein